MFVMVSSITIGPGAEPHLFGAKPSTQPVMIRYTLRFKEVERWVYWFHVVRPSVRPWTKSCPLCIFHNTSQIHFVFAHLIKQLQKVCRV